MSKLNNPMFRKTKTVDVVDDASGIDIEPFNETFPLDGPPLSVREKKRLAELEDVVTRNFKAFYDVGCALREIQQSMLYRETHHTFSDYAKDLWDMARRTAYQYIEAVDVVDRLIPLSSELKNVRNCAQDDVIPQNEAQARALVRYPEDKQIEIWREAVKTADGRITAAHIKKTAIQLHGKVVKERIGKAKQNPKQPAIKMSDGFRAAFNALLDAINEEREAEWKNTSREEVLRHLEGLVQAIGAPL